MQAAPLRANDGGLEEGNVFQQEGLRLLKTKAIYGSNASGKSNLAKAIGAFTLMVNRSVSQEGIPYIIWEDRFQLISDWDEQPVFFQYTFLINNTTYRYGFQILDSKVVYEWLFGSTPGDEEKEYLMRNSEGVQVNETHFTGAKLFVEQSPNSEVFRSDALFLTGAALNGNKIAADIRNEIRKTMTVDGVNDKIAIQFAMGVLDKGSISEKMAINQLLRAAGTGIEELVMANVPEAFLDKPVFEEVSKIVQDGNGKKLKTIFSMHKIYDENGNIVDQLATPFALWESEGTGKLLSIGALALEALQKGRFLIIDEFDARFHPNLTLKIVELFQSEETNPKNGQLIFITHDTGLLKRANLRRDQICFVDKDKYGISSLRTLIEYKGVRKDASYEKEYLQGSYAGVPYLSQIDAVIKESLKHE